MLRWEFNWESNLISNRLVRLGRLPYSERSSPRRPKISSGEGRISADVIAVYGDPILIESTPWYRVCRTGSHASLLLINEGSLTSGFNRDAERL
jgi:hypothetical protein